MSVRIFIFLILFAVLDVGTLFILAKYFGVTGALFVVAVSTLLGLITCARWIRRLAEHHDALKKEHGENIPQDLILIRGGECLLSCLAVVCFLYPGLLSDAIGFLLAFPRVQDGSMELIVQMLRSQAEREGKTVGELFR